MSDSIYKKLINALFKLSGSQAMINRDDKQSITVNATGTPVSFVAPKDGYIFVRALGAVNASEVSVAGDYTVLGGSTATSTYVGISTPIKKGEQATITIRSTQSQTISDYRAYFVALVGGELSAFLRWLNRGFGEVCYG